MATIHKLDVTSGIRQTVQFGRVLGVRNQAVAGRMNELLREGAEKTLDAFMKDLIHGRDHPEDAPDVPATTELSSKAVIGLVDSKMVAVEYRFSANGAELGRAPGWSAEPLALDLADGHRLTNKELLAPRVTTTEGAKEFSRALAASGPGGRLCATAAPDARAFFRPEELIGDESVVKIFPAATRVRFELGLWKLGFPMACNQQVIEVGYPKLRMFAGPDLTP